MTWAKNSPLASWAALLALCLGTLLVPRTGRAAGEESKIAAEALFQQALELMAHEEYRQACGKFEASQALDAGIGTLLHLADCYEHDRRPASAWATFREAESLAIAHEQDERARIAHARGQALEGKLAKLVIVVDSDSRVPGLVVRLGEMRVPAASFGAPLPLDPGDHVIYAEAPGYRGYRRHFSVKAGPGRYQVQIPRLEVASGTPSGSREASSGSALKTAGIVTGATGLAAVSAGAVLAVMASQKNQDSLDECPVDENHCTKAGKEQRDQAGTYADWATASLAAGGGLIATGVVLYLVAPSPQKKEQVALRQVALNVLPDIETKAVNVSLKGKF